MISKHVQWALFISYTIEHQFESNWIESSRIDEEYSWGHFRFFAISSINPICLLKLTTLMRWKLSFWTIKLWFKCAQGGSLRRETSCDWTLCKEFKIVDNIAKSFRSLLFDLLLLHWVPYFHIKYYKNINRYNSFKGRDEEEEEWEKTWHSSCCLNC